MTDLPTGITVLAWDGEDPAPIQQILDACEPEADPERRGAQVFLAVARSLWPQVSRLELVERVAMLDYRAAALNPAMLADVARQMGIA